MLEEFGLTMTEEKVYLALLKLGLSTAAQIIKKTQLYRTTVYDVLDRLAEKGLVSYVVQNKIKSYSAAKPSKFLDIALEETKNAEEKQKLAKKVVEELGVFREKSSIPLAQVFIGEKGLKTVMDDIIETGKDFVEFGVEGKFEQDLPLYAKQWANSRRKKNMRAKIICTKGSSAPEWKLNEVRFVPKEYKSPASTLVYGNKVAIFLQENPLFIILIESDMLAQSYKNYFDLLWKIAK